MPERVYRGPVERSTRRAHTASARATPRPVATKKGAAMADLKDGALVQHNTLGVGKVVSVEANAVHVFFPQSDRRFAAKLRLPAAGALLRTEGVERNPWLEGL